MAVRWPGWHSMCTVTSRVPAWVLQLVVPYRTGFCVRVMLYPEREQKIKWRRVECTWMVLYFSLRRGELPGCLLRLQRGVSLNAYRLALLCARSKQASYRSRGCCYLCIALGSGGTLARCQNFLLKPCLLSIRTICLSPVFSSLWLTMLFLSPIYSGDLQEVFCLAMLIIA